MNKVRVGDSEFHLVERGREGPRLLLVHGFPLDHSMWCGQLDGLSDSCRLLAPDLRGFGASTVSPGTVTMEQLADDLAAMLTVLDIHEPVTVCGLSMGGYVAWQFWARHPQRLKRLILCDTRAAADSEQVARDRLATAEKVVRDGAESLVAAMIPKLFAPRTQQTDPARIERVQRVIATTAPQGIAAALRGMAQRRDMTDQLDHIDIETLVICGDQDAITPPDEMRSLASRLPRAEFVAIPETGHMAPLENPADVNAAIRRFLSGGPR